MSMMSCNLQLRSISPAMSSVGRRSLKARSIAFGNPSGGRRLPGQFVKLELSRPFPLPMAITNVGNVRASCSQSTWWHEMMYNQQHPLNWGLVAAMLLYIIAFYKNSRFLNSAGRYDKESPVNWGMLNVSEGLVYVIERFGKYYKTLTTPGFYFLIPFVDQVAYVHRCYEHIDIPGQSVITKDGFIPAYVSGHLVMEMVDPVLASYGVGDRKRYMTGYMTVLACATIRSEVGKMTGEEIVDEERSLNEKIRISINENKGIKDRGYRCHKFKISGLSLLRAIIHDRKERAHILEPKGDAEAIAAGAQSISAEDITMVSEHLIAENGTIGILQVSSLRTAEDEVFDKIAERVAVKVVSSLRIGEDEASDKIAEQVAARAFAMIEDRGLHTDAANPCAMKGETDQASLSQCKQT